MTTVTKVILISYVGWMFDFYDLVLFSYLLPFISHSFPMTLTQKAWLLGLPLGFSGMGGILFGWLADHVGRKKVMVWTILIYSIGTALSAFSPNLTCLFLFRMFTGLGIGGEWAVGHALVAESVEPDKRGRSAAFLQSGEPVGVALAACIGLLVAPKIGWRAVLLLSGFTAIWALAVRAHLHEPRVWTHRKSYDEKLALAWLVSSSGIWTMTRAFILAFLKLGTYWTCYIWLPQLFLTRFHEEIGRSALWLITAQVGQFAGMMGFGRISDRFGRREAYLGYSLLTAVAIFILASRWEWLLGHRMLFWANMLFLGLGSGCTAGFGALFSELFPTHVRNFSMGTAYNLARGAQVFAPVWVAYFLNLWDVKGALGVPFVFAILTGLWVWTLPETRGRNLMKFKFE